MKLFISNAGIAVNAAKNRVDILLSPFDRCRMAKALGKQLHEVLYEYGNL